MTNYRSTNRESSDPSAGPAAPGEPSRNYLRFDSLTVNCCTWHGGSRMVKKIPTRLEKHGHVRIDDYYWLRERDNPEVIRYLNEENERAAAALAHTEGFEEKLFEEIKGRFKQTDMS